MSLCELTDVLTALLFHHFILSLMLTGWNGCIESPGGGLIYETDGDARRLAWGGGKFWILVSLRVFRAKRQYFKPPRSCLGFREETQNYAKRNRSQIFFFLLFFFFFKRSLLGVKICLCHTQVVSFRG